MKTSALEANDDRWQIEKPKRCWVKGVTDAEHYAVAGHHSVRPSPPSDPLLRRTSLRWSDGTHFHPKPFHPNDLFIKISRKSSSNYSFAPKTFHPKTVSSKNTFIQTRTHPLTASSKHVLIQRQFRKNTCSSKDIFHPHIRPKYCRGCPEGVGTRRVGPRPRKSGSPKGWGLERWGGPKGRGPQWW